MAKLAWRLNWSLFEGFEFSSEVSVKKPNLTHCLKCRLAETPQTDKAEKDRDSP